MSGNQWPLMLDGNALVLARAKRQYSRRIYGDETLSDHIWAAAMAARIGARLGETNAEQRLTRLSSDGSQP